MNIKQSIIRKAATAIIALTLINGQSFAQGCLVNSLTINTGWDPAAGAVITPGANGGADVNDPKWQNCGASADMTTDMVTSGYHSSGTQADVVQQAYGWSILPASNYISCFNSNQFSSVAGHTYTMSMCRSFTLCKDDCININLQVLVDNWISAIQLDGVTFFSQTVPPGHGGYWTTPTKVSQPCFPLTAGVHTITIIVNQDSYTETGNQAGLDVTGTVSSSTGINSIVSESKECANYVCSNCSDSCYWKVTGNNIIGGNNIFGTLTNDDINIVSNNTQRAIIQANGNMGIRQLVPSTTLDVDCIPVMAPSGLQFENLPVGQGFALVVDNAGYVYVSKQVLKPAMPGTDTQSQIDELKQQINDLRAQLNTLAVPVANSQSYSLSATPNPTSGAINVNYMIGSNYGSASIVITDITGREIATKAIIRNSGMENITLPASSASGQYIISLVVDGKQVAQQKEVLMK